MKLKRQITNNNQSSRIESISAATLLEISHRENFSINNMAYYLYRKNTIFVYFCQYYFCDFSVFSM